MTGRLAKCPARLPVRSTTRTLRPDDSMADHEHTHLRRAFARKIVYGILCLGAYVGVTATNPIAAAVQDSRFEFSPDGTKVVFEVTDVPRREVLDRLFAGTGIEVKWLNAS